MLLLGLTPTGVIFILVILAIIAWVVIMLINSSKNATKQNTSTIDNELESVEREHNRKHS